MLFHHFAIRAIQLGLSSCSQCILRGFNARLFPICPFIVFCWSGIRSLWQKQDIRDILVPINTFQLLLGDPEALLGKMGFTIPPTGSLPQCLQPVGLVRKTTKGRTFRRQSQIRGQNHLSWLPSRSENSSYTPSFLWKSELRTVRLSPAIIQKKTHFSCSYLWCHSFNHCLMS